MSLIERQGDACRNAVNLTETYATTGRGMDLLADAWDVAADAAEEAGDLIAAGWHRQRALEWRDTQRRGALWTASTPAWKREAPPICDERGGE